MQSSPIFSEYFDYVGMSECPTVFHRWAILSAIGALLERRIWLPFGHSKIYPNMYIVLMGSPGTRKGSAIKPAKILLEESGFKFFAPSTTSKETLWSIISRVNEGRYDDFWDQQDFDPTNLAFVPEASPMYVMRDEFTAFLGDRPKSMIETLTDLWDNPAVFSHPKLRSEDVTIHNPTINILTGTTPSALTNALDTLALSGGFTSRVLFIYSQPKDLRIAWPTPPDEGHKAILLKRLERIKDLYGEIQLTDEVRDLIAEIYYCTPRIPDARFIYYAQRRQIHLLKLIMVIAAASVTMQPTTRHVIEANTILHASEINMPQALGEFGLARSSTVANAIMEHLKHSEQALSLRELYSEVSRDLNSFRELNEVLNDLITAGKVNKVILPDGKQVYLANLEWDEMRWPEHLINYDVLTREEAPDIVGGELVH